MTNNKTVDLRRTEKNSRKATRMFNLMRELLDFSNSFCYKISGDLNLTEDKNNVYLTYLDTDMSVKKDIKALVSNDAIKANEQSARKALSSMFAELKPILDQNFYDKNDEIQIGAVRDYINQVLRTEELLKPFYKKLPEKIFTKLVEDVHNQLQNFGFETNDKYYNINDNLTIYDEQEIKKTIIDRVTFIKYELLDKNANQLAEDLKEDFLFHINNLIAEYYPLDFSLFDSYLRLRFDSHYCYVDYEFTLTSENKKVTELIIKNGMDKTINATTVLDFNKNKLITKFQETLDKLDPVLHAKYPDLLNK